MIGHNRKLRQGIRRYGGRVSHLSLRSETLCATKAGCADTSPYYFFSGFLSRQGVLKNRFLGNASARPRVLPSLRQLSVDFTSANVMGSRKRQIRKKKPFAGGSAFFAPSPSRENKATDLRSNTWHLVRRNRLILNKRTHFLNNFPPKPPPTNKIRRKRSSGKLSRSPAALFYFYC